jgi:hypothetical protein
MLNGVNNNQNLEICSSLFPLTLESYIGGLFASMSSSQYLLSKYLLSYI